MTENDKLPKPKRRWLRFNLRTLLIVLTISCIWLGWYLHRVEQQREAVQWALDNGGIVRYECTIVDNQGKFISEIPPFVPGWLVDLLGVDYFSTVGLISLQGGEVSDVTPLAGLTNLEHLYLSETQVSDVTPLAGLTNLELLGIRSTQVSDEDAEKLKQALPNCHISY